MMRIIRSELLRLRRRDFVLGWLGLSRLLSAVIVAIVVSSIGNGSALPENGPGGTFPSTSDLVQPDGFVAGLSGAATILGVLTLSYWAIATATDFSTGLIRLLVQAEPRRLRLLAGKVAALTLWTLLATIVTTVAAVLTSLIVAPAMNIDTTSWAQGGMLAALSDILSAAANLFLSMIVWGVIGLVIAIATRSSAIAIGVGVGYVLVFESIISLVSERIADWLPGSVLAAVASGGTPVVAYGTAVALSMLYAALGLGTSMVVFTRRDITD